MKYNFTGFLNVVSTSHVSFSKNKRSVHLLLQNCLSIIFEMPVKRVGVFHKCDIIDKTEKYSSKILGHRYIEIKLSVFIILFDIFRGIKSPGRGK